MAGDFGHLIAFPCWHNGLKTSALLKKQTTHWGEFLPWPRSLLANLPQPSPATEQSSVLEEPEVMEYVPALQVPQAVEPREPPRAHGQFLGPNIQLI